jgi:hypothetical protein
VSVRGAEVTDTDVLLREAGVPEAEIDALRADGAIA